MYQDYNSTKQSKDQKGEVNAETWRENNAIIIKIVMPIYWQTIGWKSLSMEADLTKNTLEKTCAQSHTKRNSKMVTLFYIKAIASRSLPESVINTVAKQMIMQPKFDLFEFIEAKIDWDRSCHIQQFNKIGYAKFFR